MAEWIDGDTAFLSVAFTWKLPEAMDRARLFKASGYKVKAGGPGLFVRKDFLGEFAEVGADHHDAMRHHNPNATIASRGCPVGCWFCIVPAMEGKDFTLLPDFPVRPILCDNNLSALPADYQDHIVKRYQETGVTLEDANSGFEPRTFDGEVYARWKKINRGPWRFAYDDMAERGYVEAVLKMLKDEPPNKKRVYCLIGNEPKAASLQRLQEIISWGGEPHAQAYMKLNALERVPQVRHDWTRQELINMARWANRRIWRYAPFEEYSRGAKSEGIQEDSMAQGILL